MFYVNDKGNLQVGEHPGEGWIQVNDPKSSYYKLKPNWKECIPDVWELDLDKIKTDKLAAIDAKTSELIAQGFSFDGKQFSLSANAQQNLATIQTLIDKDLLDPESPLSTIDDELYILRKEDAPGFVQAGYARVIPTKMLGSGLKGQVVAATTQEAIESIVDSRL